MSRGDNAGTNGSVSVCRTDRFACAGRQQLAANSAVESVDGARLLGSAETQPIHLAQNTPFDSNRTKKGESGSLCPHVTINK